MLKRYTPTQPDSINKTFTLPSTYISGDITLFINGQLLSTRDDTEHPFGYTLDETLKTFTFYTAPFSEDYLFVIYDDSGTSTGGTEGTAGTGVLKLKHGYSLISYVGAIKAMWSKTEHKVVYTNVLANVINLIIWQIEDVYGVSASSIIREIQTYDDDSGSYRTWTSSTGKAWTYNAEHITNPDLYKIAGPNDYGDPDSSNYVYYNPNAFILSSTILDTNDIVISLDEDNPIEDLPMGFRRGIHIYVLPTADLSKTNGLLEIWF